MANKREAILLIVFVSALVIVGGYLGAQWLSRDLQARREVLAGKDAEILALRHWLDEKETWESREGWIAGHPMLPYHPQRSEAEFVQTMQASLTKFGIQTIDQRIQETRESPVFVEVPVDLTIDATLEELIRWLYDIQRPDAFRVISQIRLRSTGDSAKIRAEISLYQIFAAQAATTP